MTDKIEFEILRDKERRPTVTICRISVNGDVGIGIAIRSLRDNPVERIGRVKAYGRAKKALYQRKNTLPVLRKEAYVSINTVTDTFSRSICLVKSVYIQA